jgi:hypothetical protein
LILCIRTETHEMWKTRCEELHIESGIAVLREGQGAIYTMTTMYGQEMNVGAMDLVIFKKTLAERIHDKTSSIKNWMKINNELIKFLMRRHQTKR